MLPGYSFKALASYYLEKLIRANTMLHVAQHQIHPSSQSREWGLTFWLPKSVDHHPSCPEWQNWPTT